MAQLVVKIEDKVVAYRALSASNQHKNRHRDQRATTPMLIVHQDSPVQSTRSFKCLRRAREDSTADLNVSE